MRRTGTPYFSGFNVALFLILSAIIFFSLVRSVFDPARSACQRRAPQMKQQSLINPSPALSAVNAKVTVPRLPGNASYMAKPEGKKPQDKKP
ncbi:MAG TPA: hypothetical protein VK738_18260 [Terriglobales bacterium]|jgi:hypothetical protein|nr:hypothetical protein [Terriglobales bacterium]